MIKPREVECPVCTWIVKIKNDGKIPNHKYYPREGSDKVKCPASDKSIEEFEILTED